MDYIYEEGTLERKQEEGLYDLAIRSENLLRIRNRLSNENLISQEEEIVLERVQSIIVSLILEDANHLDILDQIMEYTHKLAETRTA